MAKEIDKKDIVGDISDSSDISEIIAEDAAAEDEMVKTKKPGVAEKVASNKKLKAGKAFVVEERKSLIIIAIMIAVTVVIGFVANVFMDSAKANKKQLDSAYNNLLNEMDTFTKTNPYFTGVDNSMLSSGNKDVNWVPVHGKIDPGKVSADKQIFWDWMSPLFDSIGAQHKGSEYANSTGGQGWIDGQTGRPSEDMFYERVALFANKYNISSDNAFLTSFVSYNSYMATNWKLYNKYTLCIATTENGDYHYLAMMPMATSASAKNYTMIGFTFTVQHPANGGNATITDFNLWAPSTVDKDMLMIPVSEGQ